MSGFMSVSFMCVFVSCVCLRCVFHVGVSCVDFMRVCLICAHTRETHT